jgi:hypothetical protein
LSQAMALPQPQPQPQVLANITRAAPTQGSSAV